eukprot:8666903-Pyramimonas_sp.AAC.1
MVCMFGGPYCPAVRRNCPAVSCGPFAHELLGHPRWCACFGPDSAAFIADCGDVVSEALVSVRAGHCLRKP